MITNNPKSISILSDNPDFIEVLSEIVTQELGLRCYSLTFQEQAEDYDADLLVSDRPIANGYNFPVIVVNLPVRIRELLHNISTKLFDSAKNNVISISEHLNFSIKNKEISSGDGNIKIGLTDKETQLLEIIAKSGTSGISKEQLLKEIWQTDADLDTHTLETHVYRLRKKIKDSFALEIIKSIEGGYSL